MRVGGMSSVDVFCGPHGASGVGSEFMSSTFAVDEPRSERPIAPNMPPPFFIALAPRNNSPADGACVSPVLASSPTLADAALDTRAPLEGTSSAANLKNGR